MELLRERENIQWTIVGDGRLFKWLEFEISKRKLSACITLLGKRPIENIPSLLQEADALLVTLKNEPIFSMTIPAKLQAYLLARKPILAMINGEVANIINKSNSGIACASGDSLCLANAICRLSIMSESERLKMGDRAYEVSKKEFDRGILMNQLEEWMNGMFNRANRDSL